MSTNQQNIPLQHPPNAYFMSKPIGEAKANVSGSSASTSTSPSDCNSPEGYNLTLSLNSPPVSNNSNLGNFCANADPSANKPIYHLPPTSNLGSNQGPNTKNNASNYGSIPTLGNCTNSSIMRRHTRQWTREEDDRLCEATKILGTQSWQAVAMYVGNGRNQSQCSQRWQRVLDPKIKKSTWTESEDQKLLKFVEEYGTQRWMRISNEFGNRSDVQCRYRYNQLLKKKSRKFYPSCAACNEIESQKITNNKEIKFQKMEDNNLHNDVKIRNAMPFDNGNQEQQRMKLKSLIGVGYIPNFSVMNLMNSKAQLMEEFQNEQFINNTSPCGFNNKIYIKNDGTQKIEYENKFNLPSISSFLDDPNCAPPKKQMFD